MIPGLAAAGVVADALSQYSKFTTITQHVRGQTNITVTQLGQMRHQMLGFLRDYGQAVRDTGESYRYAYNTQNQYFYKNMSNSRKAAKEARDSQAVVREAVKGSFGTGDPASGIANTIGATLYAYNREAGKMVHHLTNAQIVMAELHTGAADTNMKLGEFAKNLSGVLPIAANLGISLSQLGGMYATLTKAGISGPQAQTQVRGLLTQIQHPTPLATRNLETVSNQTGIDLVHAFSAQGIKELGLPRVFQMLREALRREQKIGRDPTDVLSGIITQRRGLTGIFNLLSNQGIRTQADVAREMAMSGQGRYKNREGNWVSAGYGTDDQGRRFHRTVTDVMADAYKNTLPGQLQLLRGSWDALMIDLGKTVTKPAVAMLKPLTGMIRNIDHWLSEAGNAQKAQNFLKIALIVGGIGAGLRIAIGAFEMLNKLAGANPYMIAITAGIILYTKWKPFHDLVDSTAKVIWNVSKAMLAFAQQHGTIVKVGLAVGGLIVVGMAVTRIITSIVRGFRSIGQAARGASKNPFVYAKDAAVWIGRLAMGVSKEDKEAEKAARSNQKLADVKQKLANNTRMAAAQLEKLGVSVHTEGFQADAAKLSELEKHVQRLAELENQQTTAKGGSRTQAARLARDREIDDLKTIIAQKYEEIRADEKMYNQAQKWALATQKAADRAVRDSQRQAAADVKRLAAQQERMDKLRRQADSGVMSQGLRRQLGLNAQGRSMSNAAVMASRRVLDLQSVAKTPAIEKEIERQLGIIEQELQNSRKSKSAPKTPKTPSSSSGKSDKAMLRLLEKVSTGVSGLGNEIIHGLGPEIGATKTHVGHVNARLATTNEYLATIIDLLRTGHGPSGHAPYGPDTIPPSDATSRSTLPEETVSDSADEKRRKNARNEPGFLGPHPLQQVSVSEARAMRGTSGDIVNKLRERVLREGAKNPRVEGKNYVGLTNQELDKLALMTEQEREGHRHGPERSRWMADVPTMSPYAQSEYQRLKEAGDDKRFKIISSTLAASAPDVDITSPIPKTPEEQRAYGVTAGHAYPDAFTPYWHPTSRRGMTGGYVKTKAAITSGLVQGHGGSGMIAFVHNLEKSQNERDKNSMGRAYEELVPFSEKQAREEIAFLVNSIGEERRKEIFSTSRKVAAGKLTLGQIAQVHPKLAQTLALGQALKLDDKALNTITTMGTNQGYTGMVVSAQKKNEENLHRQVTGVIDSVLTKTFGPGGAVQSSLDQATQQMYGANWKTDARFHHEVGRMATHMMLDPENKEHQQQATQAVQKLALMKTSPQSFREYHEFMVGMERLTRSEYGPMQAEWLKMGEGIKQEFLKGLESLPENVRRIGIEAVDALAWKLRTGSPNRAGDDFKRWGTNMDRNFISGLSELVKSMKSVGAEGVSALERSLRAGAAGIGTEAHRMGESFGQVFTRSINHADILAQRSGVNLILSEQRGMSAQAPAAIAEAKLIGREEANALGSSGGTAGHRRGGGDVLDEHGNVLSRAPHGRRGLLRSGWRGLSRAGGVAGGGLMAAQMLTPIFDPNGTSEISKAMNNKWIQAASQISMMQGMFGFGGFGGHGDDSSPGMLSRSGSRLRRMLGLGRAAETVGTDAAAVAPKAGMLARVGGMAAKLGGLAGLIPGIGGLFGGGEAAGGVAAAGFAIPVVGQIALVVAALTGLGVILYKTNAGFRHFINWIGGGIKNAAGSAVRGIKHLVSAMVGGLSDFGGRILHAFQHGGIKGAFIQGIHDIAHGIKENFKTILKVIFLGPLPWIFDGVKNLIGHLFSSGGKAGASKGGHSIVEWIKNNWKMLLLNGVIIALTGPIGVIGLIIAHKWGGQIREKLFGLLGIVKGWGGKLLGEVVSAITDPVGTLKNAFNGIAKFWHDIGRNLIASLGDGIASMARGLFDKVKAVANAIRHPLDTAKAGWGAFSHAVGGVAGAVGDRAARAGRWIDAPTGMNEAEHHRNRHRHGHHGGHVVAGIHALPAAGGHHNVVPITDQNGKVYGYTSRPEANVRLAPHVHLPTSPVPIIGKNGSVAGYLDPKTVANTLEHLNPKTVENALRHPHTAKLPAAPVPIVDDKGNVLGYVPQSQIPSLGLSHIHRHHAEVDNKLIGQTAHFMGIRGNPQITALQNQMRALYAQFKLTPTVLTGYLHRIIGIEHGTGPRPVHVIHHQSSHGIRQAMIGGSAHEAMAQIRHLVARQRTEGALTPALRAYEHATGHGTSMAHAQHEAMRQIDRIALQQREKIQRHTDELMRVFKDRILNGKPDIDQATSKALVALRGGSNTSNVSLQWGQKLIDNYIRGIRQGDTDSVAQDKLQKIKDWLKFSSPNAHGDDPYNWSTNLMTAYIRGMTDQRKSLDNKSSDMITIVRNYMSFDKQGKSKKGDDYGQSGKNVITSIMDGMHSLRSDLEDASRTTGHTISRKIGDGGKFIDLGKHIMKWTVKGINDYINGNKDSLTALGQALAQAMGAGLDSGSSYGLGGGNENTAPTPQSMGLSGSVGLYRGPNNLAWDVSGATYGQGHFGSTHVDYDTPYGSKFYLPGTRDQRYQFVSEGTQGTPGAAGQVGRWESFRTPGGGYITFMHLAQFAKGLVSGMMLHGGALAGRSGTEGANNAHLHISVDSKAARFFQGANLGFNTGGDTGAYHSITLTSFPSAVGGGALPFTSSYVDPKSGNKMQDVLKYHDYILRAAKKYNVSPAVIAAIMLHESGGDPTAVNTDSGATGLMQVMPMHFAGRSRAQMENPLTNIMEGAKILRQFLDITHGDLRAAIDQHYGGAGAAGYLASITPGIDALQGATGGGKGPRQKPNPYATAGTEFDPFAPPKEKALTPGIHRTPWGANPRNFNPVTGQGQYDPTYAREAYFAAKGVVAKMELTGDPAELVNNPKYKAALKAQYEAWAEVQIANINADYHRRGGGDPGAYAKAVEGINQSALLKGERALNALRLQGAREQWHLANEQYKVAHETFNMYKEIGGRRGVNWGMIFAGMNNQQSAKFIGPAITSGIKEATAKYHAEIANINAREYEYRIKHNDHENEATKAAFSAERKAAEWNYRAERVNNINSVQQQFWQGRQWAMEHTRSSYVDRHGRRQTLEPLLFLRQMVAHPDFKNMTDRQRARWLGNEHQLITGETIEKNMQAQASLAGFTQQVNAGMFGGDKRERAEMIQHARDQTHLLEKLNNQAAAAAWHRAQQRARQTALTGSGRPTPVRVIGHCADGSVPGAGPTRPGHHGHHRGHQGPVPTHGALSVGQHQGYSVSRVANDPHHLALHTHQGTQIVANPANPPRHHRPAHPGATVGRHRDYSVTRVDAHHVKVSTAHGSYIEEDPNNPPPHRKAPKGGTSSNPRVAVPGHAPTSTSHTPHGPVHTRRAGQAQPYHYGSTSHESHTVSQLQAARAHVVQNQTMIGQLGNAVGHLSDISRKTDALIQLQQQIIHAYKSGSKIPRDPSTKITVGVHPGSGHHG